MMKKTNKLFLTMCVAGSFALLFGSCKKEDAKEVTVGLPTFEEEVDARAYVDYGNQNQFCWNQGDQIVVYNLDASGSGSEKAIYQTDTEDGRTYATFTHVGGDNLSAKKYGYFVFYPADKAESALEEGNYQTFTVPGTQTYTIDSAMMPTLDHAGMALACDLESVNSAFTLKHIFGALKLKLTGEGSVTKIEVEDARYNLYGTAKMKLHEVTMDQFTTLQNNFIATNDPDNDWGFQTLWASYLSELGYSAEGAGKVMTLNCETPVQLKANEPTLFPIGLRPGALKYGFQLRVYLDGQNEPVVFDYTDSNWNYGIKAGVNKNLVLSVYPES